MTDGSRYSIEFPAWYDELAEFEHVAKGHLSGVSVRLANGKLFVLSFMDPVRLQQGGVGVALHQRHAFVQPQQHAALPGQGRVALVLHQQDHRFGLGAQVGRQLGQDGFGFLKDQLFEPLGRGAHAGILSAGTLPGKGAGTVRVP